jgi:hypothetical protein
VIYPFSLLSMNKNMNSFILFTPLLNPLPWGEERAVEQRSYPIPASLA